MLTKRELLYAQTVIFYGNYLMRYTSYHSKGISYIADSSYGAGSTSSYTNDITSDMSALVRTELLTFDMNIINMNNIMNSNIILQYYDNNNIIRI